MSCRGNGASFKGNASFDVRNASRVIAPVLEANRRARRFEERRAASSSPNSTITAGLDVQLRFPIMLSLKKRMTSRIGPEELSLASNGL